MPKMVKLASGKNAEVGASFNKGGFTYKVQADGSVKRNDGRITAKPTSIKVEVSPRTIPNETARPAPRPKVAPVPVTRPAKPVNAVRPSGPVPSNKSKATVNAVRPSGPISTNTARTPTPTRKVDVSNSYGSNSVKPIDVEKQYGSNKGKKLNVGQMYGSRPAKK